MVEVATLDHGLHSGLWGGVVPDALTVLVRLLAGLHDDDGNVAVAGLHQGSAAAVDRGADWVRAESGLLDGVTEIGSGTVAAAVVGQAGDHRHRNRHHADRQGVQYADPAGPGEGQPAGAPRR